MAVAVTLVTEVGETVNSVTLKGKMDDQGCEERREEKREKRRQKREGIWDEFRWSVLMPLLLYNVIFSSVKERIWEAMERRVR